MFPLRHCVSQTPFILFCFTAEEDFCPGDYRHGSPWLPGVGGGSSDDRVHRQAVFPAQRPTREFTFYLT